MTSKSTIPIQRDKTQTLINFENKNFQGLVCFAPYIVLEIGLNGDVGLCDCRLWLPSRVGNIYTQTLKEILSGANACAIRESISNGNYNYCNEKTCGVIAQQQMIERSTLTDPIMVGLLDDSTKFIMPREIWIAGDPTCNLSCPSCRTSIIKNTNEEIEYLESLGEKLKDNLFSIPSNDKIILHVSTTGELFASPLLLKFVNSIPVQDFPNLKLAIQTNGLLVPRLWHKLGAMQDRVESITVTTDAATGSTYEVLRRGGRWNDLQTALSWIAEKKKQNNMQLIMRLVAQHANYQEMPEFYQQSQTLGADVVEYARIQNWGTFSADEFAQHDVFDPQHPEYDKAMHNLDLVKQQPLSYISGGLN
jgi:wyosine [tRNA(Phe)-imidazoG37] synthetase (radical SAM superfamily)